MQDNWWPDIAGFRDIRAIILRDFRDELGLAWWFWRSGGTSALGLFKVSLGSAGDWDWQAHVQNQCSPNQDFYVMPLWRNYRHKLISKTTFEKSKQSVRTRKILSIEKSENWDNFWQFLTKRYRDSRCYCVKANFTNRKSKKILCAFSDILPFPNLWPKSNKLAVSCAYQGSAQMKISFRAVTRYQSVPKIFFGPVLGTHRYPKFFFGPVPGTQKFFSGRILIRVMGIELSVNLGIFPWIWKKNTSSIYFIDMLVLIWALVFRENEKSSLVSLVGWVCRALMGKMIKSLFCK